MKRLFLLRHGKADRPFGMLTDKERPLLPRGREEVAQMCRKLLKKGMNPQAIISSTALRALQTAETAAMELGHDPAGVILAEAIYGAEVDELGVLLRMQDNNLDSLMLVGHNPGLEELAELLASDYHGHLPTGGIIALKLAAADWNETRPGCAVLIRTFFP
jgi:phosphohistidine phosphatase